MIYVKFNVIIFITFSIIVTSFGEDHAHLASIAKADQIERSRCGYSLMKLWTAEVAHSPFAAAPLLTDVDGDGSLDVVAGPLSEAHTVLLAETGKVLPNSHWPAQKLDSSILASPLQYDINGDGSLDILFVTSSGELLFYTANGTLIRDKTFEISPAYVKEKWHTEVVQASGQEIYNYVSTRENVANDKAYLPVDPHVMATPVIADLNNDKKSDELIIPVSYFFDEEDFRLPENFDRINNINETDLGKYVISGIVVINLVSMSVETTVYLDITTKQSGFPAYLLFSPTVIDMDRSAGMLEIVVGSSAGNIHVIEIEGGPRDRKGFPYSMGTIYGQVTVGDVNGDDTLELVAVDNSGNVVCLNDDGTLVWEAEISGTSTPGTRLIDIDADGYVEVVVATDAGDVYAISGVKGEVLQNWPIKTGHPIVSNVLATHISQSRTTLDLVFLSNDGSLHIVSTDQSCRTHFPIGETSLVQILSHDLVPESEGPEILVATNDGTLICLGSGEDTPITAHVDPDEINKKNLRLALPSEIKTPNDFLFAEKKLQVYVHDGTRQQGEVTGSHFNIQFDIEDPTYKSGSKALSRYTVNVYYGRNLLHHATFTYPSTYMISVESYPRPSRGHVTLVLTNRNGQIAQDMFPVRFNQVILEDLQWLLMAPFVTMVIILLVGHGFPAKDLLPYTFHSKTR